MVLILLGDKTMNVAEQIVWDEIDDGGGMEEVDTAVLLIEEYRVNCYYFSKNQRLWRWIKTKPDLLELVVSIFTTVLQEQSLTYQALIGMLNHKIKLDLALDRIMIIAEVAAVISKTGLIDITRYGKGESIMITTQFTMDSEFPIKNKHKLSLHRPQPITSNWDVDSGSMLLGHSANHHNDDICLDHINRMNQIPLALNAEFITQYVEQAKKQPITNEQKLQWNTFVKDSLAKYAEVLQNGNKMYSKHKPDTRGRTYSCGYHITTQGSSFKKAITELYNKELVKG